MSLMNLGISFAASNLPGAGSPAMSEALRSGSSGFSGVLGEQVRARAADGARGGQRNEFEPPKPGTETSPPPAGSPEQREAVRASEGDRVPSRPGDANTRPAAHRQPDAGQQNSARPETDPHRGGAREPGARDAASRQAASERPHGASRPGSASRATASEDRSASAAVDAPEVERGAEATPKTGPLTPEASPAIPTAGDPSAVAVPGDPASAPVATQSLMDWLARLGNGLAAPNGATLAMAETSAQGPSGALAEAAETAETVRKGTARPSAGGFGSVFGAGAALPSKPDGAGAAFSTLLATGVTASDLGLTAAATPTAMLGASAGARAAEVAAAASFNTDPSLPGALSALGLPLDRGGHTASFEPAPLYVATPVTAPDFSRAMAAQLTTLARDGVQEATLQLNPAEMGPIAVKIVLDGLQAQIDFAAEHPQTRQALEAGLPTLAAALNGAGLTLSGGGVFEQRPGAREAGADAAASRSGHRTGGQGAAATDAGGSAPRSQAVVGLVDLYA